MPALTPAPSTLTRDSIIATVSEILGVSKTRAGLLVKDVITHVCEGISQDGIVKIAGLGVFEVKATPARPARNFSTGEVVIAPAQRVLTFRPGKPFMARLQRDLDAR